MDFEEAVGLAAQGDRHPDLYMVIHRAVFPLCNYDECDITLYEFLYEYAYRGNETAEGLAEEWDVRCESTGERSI